MRLAIFFRNHRRSSSAKRCLSLSLACIGALVASACIASSAAFAGSGSFWQGRDLVKTQAETAGASREIAFMAESEQRLLLQKLGARTIIRLGKQRMVGLYGAAKSAAELTKLAKTWDTEEVVALADEFNRNPDIFRNDKDRFALRSSLYKCPSAPLRSTHYKYANRKPTVTLAASPLDVELDTKGGLYTPDQFLYGPSENSRAYDFSRLHPTGTLFIVTHGDRNEQLGYRRKQLGQSAPVYVNIPLEHIVDALLDPEKGLPRDFHGQIKLKACWAGLEAPDGSPSVVSEVARALSKAGRADIIVSGAKGASWGENQTGNRITGSYSRADEIMSAIHFYCVNARSDVETERLAAIAGLDNCERHLSHRDVQELKAALDQFVDDCYELEATVIAAETKKRGRALDWMEELEAIEGAQHIVSNRFRNLVNSFLEHNDLMLPKKADHQRVRTTSG